MAALSERHEAAILRTLRDIEAGHITLRCLVIHYDTTTGERLPEPELVETEADRAPAAGYPRIASEPWWCWWDLLAERGWIRLPTEREPSCWQVTEEGRSALQAGGRCGPPAETA